MTARSNRFITGSAVIQDPVVAAEFPAPKMESLIGQKISLIDRLQGIGRKALESLCNPQRKRPKRARKGSEFCKFPDVFPARREFRRSSPVACKDSNFGNAALGNRLPGQPRFRSAA